MSHTRSTILIHCVFSTKDRRPLIPVDLKTCLWPYIAGIARLNEFKALAVGGTQDHAHALLSLPVTMTVAKAMQLIKGGSSKWINDHLHRRSFAWQEGYGAFTIGMPQLQTTIRYINNQERHHTRMSFDSEWKRMLKHYGLSELPD